MIVSSVCPALGESRISRSQSSCCFRFESHGQSLSRTGAFSIGRMVVTSLPIQFRSRLTLRHPFAKQALSLNRKVTTMNIEDSIRRYGSQLLAVLVFGTLLLILLTFAGLVSAMMAPRSLGFEVQIAATLATVLLGTGTITIAVATLLALNRQVEIQSNLFDYQRDSALASLRCEVQMGFYLSLYIDKTGKHRASHHWITYDVYLQNVGGVMESVRIKMKNADACPPVAIHRGPDYVSFKRIERGSTPARAVQFHGGRVDSIVDRLVRSANEIDAAEKAGIKLTDSQVQSKQLLKKLEEGYFTDVFFLDGSNPLGGKTLTIDFVGLTSGRTTLEFEPLPLSGPPSCGVRYEYHLVSR